MRIAIMGRGNVGSTLGGAWAEAGHEVRFGRRGPRGADEMSHVEAAAWGDAVVLTTPARAAVDLASMLGDLGERLVVDCTNPLRPGLAGLDHGDGRSGAERIRSAASGGRVFKAFNSVGADVMASPVMQHHRVMMPFCGEGEGADRERVAGLVADVGFEPVDAGPLERALQLEHLAYLWIRLAVDTELGRSFGFGVLRREPVAARPR